MGCTWSLYLHILKHVSLSNCTIIPAIHMPSAWPGNCTPLISAQILGFWFRHYVYMYKEVQGCSSGENSCFPPMLLANSICLILVKFVVGSCLLQVFNQMLWFSSRQTIISQFQLDLHVHEN